MNSTKTGFAGGKIHQTDYFDSADRDRSLAWLVIYDHAWHVPLPRPLPHLIRAPSFRQRIGAEPPLGHAPPP